LVGIGRKKEIMTSPSWNLETQAGYDIFLTARKTMNEFDVFFLFVSHGNVHIIQYDKMGCEIAIRLSEIKVVVADLGVLLNL
jgi:hypothetical protein